MTKRNMGRFKLSKLDVADNRVMLREIMQHCTVLDSEIAYESRSVKYVALSDQFDESAPGEPLPEYEWEKTDDGWKAVRQNN